MGSKAKSEMMCPRFPEPLPLEHPIPSLKEALEKVGQIRMCVSITLAQGRARFQAGHGNPLHQMLVQSTEGD